MTKLQLQKDEAISKAREAINFMVLGVRILASDISNASRIFMRAALGKYSHLTLNPSHGPSMCGAGRAYPMVHVVVYVLSFQKEVNDKGMSWLWSVRLDGLNIMYGAVTTEEVFVQLSN